MIKTYKYRLYPTSKIKKILESQLEECRNIYNALISIKKASYYHTNKSLNYYDFANQLSLWKKEEPELTQLHSQVIQDVLKRVDKAYQNFFRRVKNGETPGYPRFKNKGRYDSLTYPQYGNSCSLDGNVLHLSKIGDVKVVLHRSIEEQIKNLIIKKTSTGKWYVNFFVETTPVVLQPNENAVGIDVGLMSFAKFNSGETIKNPRFLKQDEAKLQRLQSRRDKAPKGSILRKKLSKQIRYLHERIKNKRSDFAHKESRKIVNNYYVIAVEKLNVKNMMEDSYLAKSIGDAAWTQFRNLLSYKAVEAGRRYVEVDPAYTSQTCSNCGNKKKLELKDRIYQCDCCGLKMDRDQNAAINILTVGLHSLNLPTGFGSPRL